MPNYLCLSSHALLIISINNKWLKHKITCQNSYHRKDRYTLIELCDCSIRVNDCSIRLYRSFCDSYFYMQEFVLLQNILPIMLALCSMLSGTYYAHTYGSIIGGSLISMILYPIGTKFATELPARQGSLHTKFEGIRCSHFRNTSCQSFHFFSSCFCTLAKIAIKRKRVLRSP